MLCVLFLSLVFLSELVGSLSYSFYDYYPKCSPFQRLRSFFPLCRNELLSLSLSLYDDFLCSYRTTSGLPYDFTYASSLRHITNCLVHQLREDVPKEYGEYPLTVREEWKYARLTDACAAVYDEGAPWFPDIADYLSRYGVVSERCWSWDDSSAEFQKGLEPPVCPTWMWGCPNDRHVSLRADQTRLLFTPETQVSWDVISSSNVTELRNWLLQSQLAITYLSVPSEFRNYLSGVYTGPFRTEENNVEIAGSIPVVVSGFDEKEDSWTIRPDIRRDWGENGFMRISSEALKAMSSYRPWTESITQEVTFYVLLIDWEGDDSTLMSCGDSYELEPGQYVPSGGCSSHGTCSPTRHDGSCICDSGWTGWKCQSRLCDPPCGDHERCSTDGTYCECEEGWRPLGGENSVCVPYCSNCRRGTCLLPERCICDAGWTGDACDVPNCAHPTCSGHGECLRPPTLCACEEGWKGDSCDIGVDDEYQANVSRIQALTHVRVVSWWRDSPTALAIVWAVVIGLLVVDALIFLWYIVRSMCDCWDYWGCVIGVCCDATAVSNSHLFREQLRVKANQLIAPYRVVQGLENRHEDDILRRLRKIQKRKRKHDASLEKELPDVEDLQDAAERSPPKRRQKKHPKNDMSRMVPTPQDQYDEAPFDEEEEGEESEELPIVEEEEMSLWSQMTGNSDEEVEMFEYVYEDEDGEDEDDEYEVLEVVVGEDGLEYLVDKDGRIVEMEEGEEYFIEEVEV